MVEQIFLSPQGEQSLIIISKLVYTNCLSSCLTVVSFFYQETFCLHIYDETAYIPSYTDVLHANIFSPPMIWE